MPILNLTLHSANSEQLAAGVIEPSKTDKVIIKLLLTFDLFADTDEIEVRAEALAEIAKRYDVDKCMISGPTFLMHALERSLKVKFIRPFYSFSERVSVESISSTGEITKSCGFKHKGFVEV